MSNSEDEKSSDTRTQARMHRYYLALAHWPNIRDLCATATDTAHVLPGKAMYSAMISGFLERAIRYPSSCKADEAGFGEAATMLVDR